MNVFHEGLIDGVVWKPLKKFEDARGWLCELFRTDEVPEIYRPLMAYISVTNPGIARGPHEHADQADYFCFLGPGNFMVYLWDNRRSSPSYRAHQREVVGEDNPKALIIPAGVVHAYRNVGPGTGVVFNCPNRLFKGEKRSEPVDEIRHEDKPDSPFVLD
jgi:dTDP-4-dehydrorhamnose 3,5-epimerase